MWKEQSWDNFSHNSTWAHTKGQKCEGRVSENKDFSSLFLAVFMCLSAAVSEAAVQEYVLEMAPWAEYAKMNLLSKSGLKKSEATGQVCHS